MVDKKWTSICYLAGPYRASSEFLVWKNIEIARNIAVLLWYYGFVVICPHLNTMQFGGAYGLPDDVWLEGDLEILKRCDFMVVLPGWEFSEGTKKEIEMARQAGIHVYFWCESRTFLANYYNEGGEDNG